MELLRQKNGLLRQRDEEIARLNAHVTLLEQQD